MSAAALAIEYLRWAVKRGVPVPFILFNADRADHSQAVRLLSKRKLIEKVETGCDAQHWQPTEQGRMVVAEGVEFSAIVR